MTRRRVLRRELPIHDRRDDIQALRAVAVTLVVVYHLWPDVVPGGFVGVDVFFVISGFLITRNLLASPPRGMADVVGFWGRRVRRLLPAAFLVLAVTVFATHFLAPQTEWARTSKEAVASALNVQNWVLVQQASDYLGAGNPTAVQHFWSLSVEEQFYLVWPVLMIGAATLAGRRFQARSVARVVVLAVLVASLWHGISITASSPDAAYFLTTARVWELAAGGLLATWIPPVKVPFTRTVAAWLGLILIVTAALTVTSSTPWPGTAALLPVVGAVLFIWSACGEPRGPGVILGGHAVQRVGDLSYSIYLWHWPILVLAPFALDRDLTQLDRVGVVALTLALAWATFTVVEHRWRVPDPRTPTHRPFQLAALAAAFLMVVSTAQGVGVRLTDRAVAMSAGGTAAGTASCFGAAALDRSDECPPASDGPVVPSPASAASDRAEAFDDGCLLEPPFTEVRRCTYGTGATQVALVGNSHATHWLPALQEIADSHDLTITTFFITACSTVDARLAWPQPERAAECEQWRDDVMAQTRGDRFDLVVTSQLSVYPVEGFTRDTTYDAWVTGMRSFLRGWTSSGTPVLVIRDTPLPRRNMPRCVAEHLDDQAACSAPRADWERPDPLVEAAQGLPGARTVDLNDHLCTATRCSAVVGGVLAYFDHSHLTATFGRTLAPYLAPAVTEALDYARSTVSIASGLD